MKKITRIAALLATITTLVFTGCSNFMVDATVTETKPADTVERAISFNITSDSNLIDFETVNESASRTITPAAYKVDELTFYYQYKNLTDGKNEVKPSTSTATKLTVTKDDNDASGKTGTVTINLTAAEYEFTLYAVKGAVASDTLSDLSTAVLKGTATADLRTTDAVNFFLTSEGLTASGSVEIGLYTDGWTFDSSKYAGSIDVTYTKKTGTFNENDKVTTSQNITSIGASAAAKMVYTKDLTAGTYNFVVTFTDKTTGISFEWSDRIIVLPGQKTEKTIGIPQIIETKPAAPAKLTVGYIDPETDTEYYTGQFVWTDSSYNEKFFQLQIVEIPNGATGTIAQPTDDSSNQWGSLVIAGKNAAKNTWDNYIYGTLNEEYSIAKLTPISEATYKVFYGQPESGYIAGSLSKNNTYARMYLKLGTRYIARIRAVNDMGASDWTYATINEDQTAANGAVAATKFTSSTISRFKITYVPNGGTYDKTSPYVEPDKSIYYYSEDTTTGNPIMQADGSVAFASTTKKHLLKYGSKNWTNWISAYDSTGTAITGTPNGITVYNEVGVAPAAYKGCVNLRLSANFATIGNVEIFDDSKYLIGNITPETGTPAFTISTQDTLALTIAQSNTAETIKWKVAYPANVKYDKIEMLISRTNKQGASYSIVPTTGSDNAVFEIPYKTFPAGIYQVKILAYTKVKPRDPYQKTIILNIRQTEVTEKKVAVGDSIVIEQVSGTNNIRIKTIPDYTEAFTYEWYKDDVIINTATGSSITITATGSYKVLIKGTATATSNTITGTFIASFAGNIALAADSAPNDKKLKATYGGADVTDGTIKIYSVDADPGTITSIPAGATLVASTNGVTDANTATTKYYFATYEKAGYITIYSAAVQGLE